MTFKQITSDLMHQGWRAYHITDLESLLRGTKLNRLAIRSLIEIQVYEGKDIIFIKTYHPPIDVQAKKETDGA